jgi:hypothetical protein
MALHGLAQGWIGQQDSRSMKSPPNCRQGVYGGLVAGAVRIKPIEETISLECSDREERHLSGCRYDQRIDRHRARASASIRLRWPLSPESMFKAMVESQTES